MIFAALMLAFGLAQAGVINDQLATYQLRFANEGAWSVKRNSEIGSGEKRIRTLDIQSGDVIVEMSFLHSLSAYQIEQETKADYASVLSAYRATGTPYVGAVSRKLSCDKEFFPKDVRTEFVGQRARALFGFATERRTFGVCNMDEAKMEFAFTTATLPGDILLKLTAFRKKRASPDAESWKKLLADFKVLPAAGGKNAGKDAGKIKSP